MLALAASNVAAFEHPGNHISVLNERLPSKPCDKCGAASGWKEAGMRRTSIPNVFAPPPPGSGVRLPPPGTGWTPGCGWREAAPRVAPAPLTGEQRQQQMQHAAAQQAAAKDALRQKMEERARAATAAHAQMQRERLPLELQAARAVLAGAEPALLRTLEVLARPANPDPDPGPQPNPHPNPNPNPNT